MFRIWYPPLTLYLRLKGGAMSYRVPFVDPKTHYRTLKEEIDGAIIDCLTKGDLIYRHQLRTFEENLAAFVGVRYAVGLNSGYHALHFSLLSAGVGPGDEVITVGHTFVATVSAIVHCGATPVLVDVRDDYNMDPALLEKAITPKTKAVIPVHLNGRVCDMERVMTVANQRGLAVIEDAAQALGATYKGRRAGSFGATGCFSFYPFKILGGFGDGGAITTNDPHIARMVSLLRYNGEDRETGEYHYHGYTALLDNVQAAVLDVKLRHLPRWIEHRREIASLYQKGLDGISGLALPHFEGRDHFDIFQNYVIRTPQRDALREHLKKNGVETLVHWPKPMWEHKGLDLRDPHLAHTERISREVISLPMSAETTSEQVATVAGAIRLFFGKGA
jgi:dTDP-4-amino-4,6-dideoxygalactose transaminase